MNSQQPTTKGNHWRFWLLLFFGIALASSQYCTGADSVLVAPFTRITNGPISSEVLPSVVAAWGDYDNDGWLDLYFGNGNVVGESIKRRNSLFRNNRDGTFLKITNGPIATNTVFSTHSTVWVDYNNDGRLDLALSDISPEREKQLYRNSGAGAFVRVTTDEVGPFVSDLSRSVAISGADYDRDGLIDFFVGNGALVDNRKDFLYHNEGQGRFVRKETVFTQPELMTTQGTWADYDKDGDPDLLVTHSGYLGNSLFRNDGGGHFTDVTEVSGLGGPSGRGDSVGSAWGDYDNDGDLDLLILNESLSGPKTSNFLYRNEGDGTFTRITEGSIVTDSGHFVSAAWIDYDNDGWLDLLVTAGSRDTNVKNRLYRNLGNGVFAPVTAGSLVADLANAGGAAWGDYDNDGFLDVAVANGTIFAYQRNGLYHNDGNSNSWIKLKCIGTVSNRSAIGTRVWVKATIGGKERRQLRQIAGSEGWLTFNALDVVVGLGDATLIDTILIEWPSGLTQELHNIVPRQALTITEGVTLVMTRVDDQVVNLTWSAEGNVLESTKNLSQPDWQPVPGVTAKSHNITTGQQQFFRLHQP